MKKYKKLKKVAERGFDPPTFELWAQRDTTTPPCLLVYLSQTTYMIYPSKQNFQRNFFIDDKLKVKNWFYKNKAINMKKLKNYNIRNEEDLHIIDHKSLINRWAYPHRFAFSFFLYAFSLMHLFYVHHHLLNILLLHFL